MVFLFRFHRIETPQCWEVLGVLWRSGHQGREEASGFLVDQPYGTLPYRATLEQVDWFDWPYFQGQSTTSRIRQATILGKFFLQSNCFFCLGPFANAQVHVALCRCGWGTVAGLRERRLLAHTLPFQDTARLTGSAVWWEVLWRRPDVWWKSLELWSVGGLRPSKKPRWIGENRWKRMRNEILLKMIRFVVSQADDGGILGRWWKDLRFGGWWSRGYPGVAKSSRTLPTNSYKAKSPVARYKGRFQVVQSCPFRLEESKTIQGFPWFPMDSPKWSGKSLRCGIHSKVVEKKVIHQESSKPLRCFKGCKAKTSLKGLRAKGFLLVSAGDFKHFECVDGDIWKVVTTRGLSFSIALTQCKD